MPIHDWTRVYAGMFHHFHSTWITHLAEALNGGVLPEGYYALVEQHAGAVLADVLTLAAREEATEPPGQVPQGALAVAEAPPQVSIHLMPDERATYRLARRTLTIRHRSGRRIVAMIEILSPGNKDSVQHLREFVDKAVAAIRAGIHLLVIDLFPPGRHDPRGVHAEIWAYIGEEVEVLTPDRPLLLASYRADGLPDAYLEPVAVGTPLPDMPLFLTSEHYVPVPLGQTYDAAYRGLPAMVKDVLEGRMPPEGEERAP